MHTTVYIADCDPNGGIAVYDFCDGRLLAKQQIPLDRPMFLCYDDNRVYCVLRAPFADGTSGVLSFSVAEDGTLSQPSDLVSTNGVVGCHLCVKDGAVFTANYLSGSINKLGVKTVTHTGKGVHPTRQDAPHTHFTRISPDGNYLFVCDLGLDTVFVYDRDLSLISTAKVPAGHGVRHLEYAADGKIVYSVNELASTLSVFEYADGKLTYVTTVNALPPAFSGANTAAAIKRDQNTLYVSHRGYDGICVLDIQDVIPRWITSFPSGGKSPRDFEIVGNTVIVTNEGGNIAVLDKNDFTLLQEIPKHSPLCVISKSVERESCK